MSRLRKMGHISVDYETIIGEDNIFLLSPSPLSNKAPLVLPSLDILRR